MNINLIIKNANKGISVIKKLHLSLLRAPLLTIYQLSVRPHLDYGACHCHIRKVRHVQPLISTPRKKITPQ